jgi:uncharacterized protein (TIGR02145 family)
MRCVKQPGTVTDADGNTYTTVRIGTQVWTVENLRTTKFNDGTPIPHVTDSVEWQSMAEPAYCFYGNTENEDTIRRFGALYNWFCVQSNRLAPPGWRIPTTDDWITLRDYLIKHGYNWDRRRSGNEIAKALASPSGWKPFNIEGNPGHNMKTNNRSGFSGVAAGYRFSSSIKTTCCDAASTFTGVRHKAAWWSVTPVNETQAYSYGLGFCCEQFIEQTFFEKKCGYSIRLVRYVK